MQVFISYSRTDVEFAERARDQIRGMGYDTWRDLDNIRKGEHWDDAIDKGLNRSEVIVGILSPDSVTSSSVKNEWAWALANDRPLILLFHRPCAIPHRYVRINYIDFTRDDAAAIEQLRAALKNPARVVSTQDMPLPAGIVAMADRSPVSAQIDGDVDGTLNVAGDDIIYDQRTVVAEAPSPEQEADQRNRRILLEKVRVFWVKSVLERSLHGAALIALGMQENPDAVDHPWGMVMKTLHWETELLPIGTRIIDLFEQLGRSLLILGDPGSGKTTMLLELARDAIAAAEDDPQEPMPLVFNLSSWCEQTPAIEDWLVAELNDKYLVPEDIGKGLVKGQKLLLLLDGLDEVRSEQREACVAAINDFRRDFGLTPLVVCSRTADYEALSGRLKLEGAVVLQPLTGEQVDRYIASAGPKLGALRQALQDDPMLQEMAQSPLILSIMTLAYSDMPIQSSQDGISMEARRAHLFNAYIDRMFERRPVTQRYTREETIRWLAWLGAKMSERAQTVFLIERLQPSWLDNDAHRMSYSVGTRVVGGVVPAIVLGSMALVGHGALSAWVAALTGNPALGFGVSIGLISGVLLALCGLITGVLVVGRSAKRDINVVEAVGWSWRGAMNGFFVGLAGGLAGGLIAGPVVSIVRGLSLEPLIILGTGLGSGVCFGLSFALIGGLSSKSIGTTTVPNEGIRQSARTGLFVGISTGILVALLTAFLIGIAVVLVSGFNINVPKSYLIPILLAAMVGLGAGLVVGAIGGLLYGVRQVLRHITLRLILMRAGLIPRNYADFLDYAVDHIFMRRVGGGYIFIHRLLLEHFASLAGK